MNDGSNGAMGWSFIGRWASRRRWLLLGGGGLGQGAFGGGRHHGRHGILVGLDLSHELHHRPLQMSVTIAAVAHRGGLGGRRNSRCGRGHCPRTMVADGRI